MKKQAWPSPLGRPARLRCMASLPEDRRVLERLAMSGTRVTAVAVFLFSKHTLGTFSVANTGLGTGDTGTPSLQLK